MTNTNRASYSIVKLFIERAIKPGELNGVQMKELEEALISMDMQQVYPEFAEGFLKSTGLPESYAKYYRDFVNFDPTVVDEETNVEDIGKVITTDNSTTEAKVKAKAAKTAFDFIARELGVFSAEYSAEEQLKIIVNKIKDLKDAEAAGALNFAYKLYQDCFFKSANNLPLATIVKEFKNAAEDVDKFTTFKVELSDLLKKYN